MTEIDRNKQSCIICVSQLDVMDQTLHCYYSKIYNTSKIDHKSMLSCLKIARKLIQNTISYNIFLQKVLGKE